MKYLTLAAVIASFAVAPVALAQDKGATTAPANKADCEKAKMKWDDKAGKEGKGACIAAKAEVKTDKKS